MEKLTEGQKYGYRLLACAIIKQAVMDYREKRANDEPVSQVSRFFNSDWCDTLLWSTDLTGKDILKKLKENT